MSLTTLWEGSFDSTGTIQVPGIGEYRELYITEHGGMTMLAIPLDGIIQTGGFSITVEGYPRHVGIMGTVGADSITITANNRYGYYEIGDHGSWPTVRGKGTITIVRILGRK